MAVAITILVFVGLWVCDVCTEYMWVQGLRRMLGVFCYFALHSFETESLSECELPVSPRLKVRSLGSQEQSVSILIMLRLLTHIVKAQAFPWALGL